MRKIVFVLPALLLLGAGCSLPFQTRNIAQCTYDGVSYRAGESFAAIDGCNTCTCGETGAVGCTKMACVGQNAVQPQCQTDADCEAQNLDKSFCDQGSWQCVNAMCELRCDVTTKISE